MSHEYKFTVNWFQKEKQKRWLKIFEKFAKHEHIMMLEIGSYEGRSSCWFCEKLGDRLRLDTIDPFVNREVRENFMHNTQPWRDKGIITHYEEFATRPLAWMLSKDTEYDLIHIDGSHEAANVVYDGVMAMRMCKVGGVVCFDDYKWKAEDTILPPREVIDVLYKAHKPFFTVLHKSDQLWLEKTRDFNSFMRMSMEDG